MGSVPSFSQLKQAASSLALMGASVSAKPAAFASWMRTIARREIYHYYKKIERAQTKEEKTQKRTEKEKLRKEKRMAGIDLTKLDMREAVNTLPDKQKEAVLLREKGYKVKEIAETDDPKEKDRIASEMSSALKQRLSYDRDVDSQYFYAQAESLHEDFSAKLSENFPNLTQQEKRLATLLRLGFSSKYIATLMNITPKSVEIGRYRLRQKLGLSKGDNLVNFIKSI
jgi:DNA-directed RNA polymerase specialized sigma24 family protein